MDKLRNEAVLIRIIENSMKYFKKESWDGKVDLLDVSLYVVENLSAHKYSITEIVENTIYAYYKYFVF